MLKISPYGVFQFKKLSTVMTDRCIETRDAAINK